MGCKAQPVVSKDRARFGSHPIVVSAKRFNGILSRAHQEEKVSKLAAIEEERKYRQYLKEGNDVLVSLSKGVVNNPQNDKSKDSKEVKYDNEENEISKQKAGQMRKERILRANQILENMKQGQRSLRSALLESEMLHQRKYNEALNRAIMEEGKRHEEFLKRQCPQILIPFSILKEDEQKEERKEKAMRNRKDVEAQIETKRQNKLDELDKAIFEGIVEREQYKCLHEKEQQQALDKKKHKIKWYQAAYKDALKEKADIAKYNEICESIDDRQNCVYQVARYNLDSRYNKHMKQIQNEIINQRELFAIRSCQKQKAAERIREEKDVQEIDHYEMKQQVDEEQRQCKLRLLSQERAAFQEEERRESEIQRQKEFEIHRFERALRLKNEEASKFHKTSEQRQKLSKVNELKEKLEKQREEFLERKEQRDLAMFDICERDEHLLDDKKFLKRAVKVMNQSKELDRPLQPIAIAAKKYIQSNKLDNQPQRRKTQRSALHDYCLPGYIKRAERKYKQYEYQDRCRAEQETERRDIINNCLKISQIAAQQQKTPKCITEYECLKHRGMPTIDSNVDLFNCDLALGKSK